MSPQRAHRTANSHEGTDLLIRRAGTADAVGITRIYNHYVDVGGATFDTCHWTCEEVGPLVEIPDPDGWYVAVDRDAIVGWASARRYSARFGYRLTCESSIYLDPASIGRGVADALQLRLEEHCRQCGIHHAVARIIADNDRSMAFHYRYGYELVGIQKEIGNMDERWADVAILQKIF